MAAAVVPPRPVLRVPRPERTSGRPSARPTRNARSAPRAPTKSEPRLSLHSVDLEELPTEPAEQARDERVSDVAPRPSDTHARATLLHPLDEHDALDVVLEALRNVRCERAVEAASVCLAALVRAVGCRAALAHLWDAKEKDFVLVYALAANPGVLLNARHGLDDSLFVEAFGKKKPRVINYDGVRTPPARHGVLSGAWSVLVAPVTDGDMKLGVLELIDPLDGSCFDDRSVMAAHYAAERLADLLHEAKREIGKVIVADDE